MSESKSRTLSKKTSQGSRQQPGRFFVALIVFGALLFSFATYRKYVYYAALTPDLVVQDTSNQDNQHWPVNISVGAMVDTPVVTGSIKDGEWKVAENQAVYLAQSAVPGSGGNTIVYGHNTPEVLGNIRAFTGGETITLKLADGSERRYAIEKMVEVVPDDVALLQPTEEEVLTVYTCSGWLDSKRWVVRARPVGDSIENFESSI